MRSDRALCSHLAGATPGPAPFTLAPGEILEWRDAPARAVVRCAVCGACGWLELVERNARGLDVFALAGLRAEDVALYLRNLARGSCDVGRARAELEALEASRGPFERRLVLNPDATELIAVEVQPAEVAGR